MAPNYKVGWYNPVEEIPELESASVEEIVMDKLQKAYAQFRQNHSSEDLIFVTDVALYMEQLKGHPGPMIKRETKARFGGDFGKWCSFLDASETRNAHITTMIAACNSKEHIIIKHQVKGTIPLSPLDGPNGFDWDNIFVPEPSLVSKEYRGKSFAQIPESVKLHIIMDPAIAKFKSKLDSIEEF